VAYAQKTVPTSEDADAFVQAIDNAARRADAGRLLEILGRASAEAPKLWGGSIVGFGRYAYRYPSGHRGESFLTGFSPRKAAITIYVMDGFDSHAGLMSGLGKFTTSKSCLYVKKLADIDEAVLEELIQRSVARMRALYPD